MKLIHGVLLLFGLALVLLPTPHARGYGEISGDDHAINDMWQPTYELSLRDYRSWAFDGAGGMKWKLKSVKLGGEKLPAVEFKSGQDSGFGFFNAGLRMGSDWTVRATYAFPKAKGLRVGSSFAAVEVDFPYVPVGTIPTNFLVAGVTYQSDGLSTFANDSGSTTGTQASYPGTTAVDLQVRYRFGSEFTISSRANGTTSWDTIFSGDPSAMHDMPVGVGFGVSNVDKKARVYLTDLCAEGDLFESGRQSVLDDLQAAIDLEQEALDASDLNEKRTKLEEAAGLIDDLGSDLFDAWFDGDVDIDIEKVEKLVKKILKQDDKVLDKLDPDRLVLEFGTKERKRVTKAIKKKRELAEIIQAAVPGPGFFF